MPTCAVSRWVINGVELAPTMSPRLAATVVRVSFSDPVRFGANTAGFHVTCQVSSWARLRFAVVV